ncbi:MAG: hypothetical protein WAU45_19565 [Blastocatellia bacterium]
MLASRFEHNNYLVRRKVLKLFGGSFYVYDPAGQVVLFASMKAFKLKEDIRLYTGEDMQMELLLIAARRVLDISAEYDVTDTQTREKVGVLKRKGLKSMVRDEWILMDPRDQPIGALREDSTAMALIRRFIPFANLIPQRYEGEIGGSPVCTFKQNINPFVSKVSLDFSQDVNRLLDRRLGLALALLLLAIEGKQQ